MNKIVVIIYFLFVSIILNAQVNNTNYSKNEYFLIDYNEIKCSDMNEMIKFNKIKNKKNIKYIQIKTYGISNELPFTVNDFPNLERLDIHAISFYDLKGIESFKELKSLHLISINNELWDNSFNAIPILQNNISRVWNIKTLEELELSGPFLVFGGTISKLNNLKKLLLHIIYIPFEEIEKLKKLKKFEIVRFETELDKHNNGFPIDISNYQTTLVDFHVFRNKLKNQKIQLISDCDVNWFQNNTLEINENGKYELFYSSGKKAVEGWFKNGVRDSIWKYYFNSDSLNIVFDYTEINKFKNDTINFQFYYYKIEKADTIKSQFYFCNILDSIKINKITRIINSKAVYNSSNLFVYNKNQNKGFFHSLKNFEIYDFNRNEIIYFNDSTANLLTKYGLFTSNNQYIKNQNYCFENLSDFIKNERFSLVNQLQIDRNGLINKYLLEYSSQIDYLKQ